MDVAEDDENLFSNAKNIGVDEVFQDDDVEYVQGRDIESEAIDTYEMPIATTVRDNAVTQEMPSVENLTVEKDLLIVDAKVILLLLFYEIIMNLFYFSEVI